VKLARGLTVAKQLNSVLTNTTRPSPSTATSCTSRSPVVWLSIGTYSRSCPSCSCPAGSTFSKRHSWYSVLIHSPSALAHSPMHLLKVRSNSASRPPGCSPTRNSLPAWYVVNARLTAWLASQPGSPREPRISRLLAIAASIPPHRYRVTLAIRPSAIRSVVIPSE
jgi:hypothetical protein